MTGTLNSLSDKTLADLPATVGKPAYDRSDLKTGIIHLGIGAFHRAHQAVYTENILQDDTNWGITGVSLRSPDTRDALAPQDYLYSVAVRDGAGEKLRVIGCLTDILVAPENPQAVLETLCQPDVRIVTLTVTEKGYCYLPANRTLDENHADIIHDLQNPQVPRSAPAFLTEAIKRRRDKGLSPFTILSCDNLPANGETLRRVTIRLAELTDPELARYIAEQVAFPSSMIDRIVPATTDADRASVSRILGAEDQWPVCTEPFSQWVIEDHFPSGRPAWEKAGVTFVRDVAAFELMKLRLLNGSHSTLAYLGYLAGHQTVSDTMTAAGFKNFIRTMMDDEITPTLPELSDFNLTFYKDQLIERFCNP
ncbi:MAG: mannitol dehydrogenase family protein, partial [Brucellaceae bacterium]|nr:mannitol dehydrogenase family protein [Brucellaceae bacterium]